MISERIFLNDLYTNMYEYCKLSSLLRFTIKNKLNCTFYEKNPLYNSCILYFIILSRIEEFFEITVNQDILKCI